jgi:hypothetical protein
LPTVVLGWEPHLTFWKIVSVENNLVGTPVLTLKAHHSLGDTPKLNLEDIPTEAKTSITEAIEKVELSVNRLASTEVIDRCRDGLSIVFGWACGDMTKDLSAAIDAYVKKSDAKENLCSWCGRIVARLHSRGKPNEQLAKQARPPTDDDAQLALRCLKTVLIELKWAQ